jgi:serine/threonine protein kinase
MKIPESLKWKATGRTVGEGGQAQILEVIDKTTESDKTFALKPLGRNKPKQAYERFNREIQAIKAANHPYVIKILDHSSEGDDFNYYVMELIQEAVPLKTLIESGNNLFYREPAKALRLFMKLLEVIIECDTNLSIVHRDLSPANVLILPDDTIRVIDFGICQIEGTETITLVDEGVGTIDYMAPECGSGATGTISGKSDLYSAGKILWSAVTGRKAFAREDPIWGEMALTTLFPDQPNTWHLSPILEKAIQEKEYNRPLPHELLELSKKILSVLEAGFPPIELVGKLCQVCGFGELASSYSGQAWSHPPPPNTVFLQCNHCGFYFARDKTTYDKSVRRGKPEVALSWRDRLRGRIVP